MIYEKLQKARIELQSKNLKKSGKNKFSGFSYYELADFLPQVNQIFYDLKLCSNFSIKDNTAILIVTDWEDNTQQIFTSPIEELELKGCTKIQALGGIHTYMKRYLYINALEIVEADMLDAKAGDIEEVKKEKKTATKQSIDDQDIYIQLCTLTDIDEMWAYYHQYKDKVNDKQKLYKQVQEQIKTVKKVAATKPEEDFEDIPF